MSENNLSSENIITLERGGFLVKSSIGYIQFGSPPETIKDTMLLPGGVPQIFVLPQKFFNWKKGISVAEVEFPIYYNFFFKKRKTYILCDKDQYKRFKVVLNEAIFGPEEIDLSIDLDDDYSESGVNDIKKEIDFFRGSLTLSDMVGFIQPTNGSFHIKDVVVEVTEEKEFIVKDKGEKIARVPGRVEYVPKYDIGERLPEPFLPPVFGVTCLGPSHGFDPTENTSGYIIWLNRHGIMVDPPVNSTEWLKDSNVNPKLIDSIILTHCHADHDAGAFQKILEEGIVNVYTTPTIMQSFLKKYSAITDTSPEYLMKLFNFCPIKLGKPEFINSARLEMYYSLHSIPTIGFKMIFQGKSLVYSSDHNNDPELHQKLFKEGLISKKRLEELSSFPWESDVIFHESGIPPLHTPIKYLNSLPKEIQKKTIVYHISKKDFPEETNLRLAKFGIENTLYFDVDVPDYESTYHMLRILNFLDFADDMPVSKIQQFVSIVKEEKFKKGELIIKHGTKGNRFYIIQSGNVKVVAEHLENRKIYGACDYFGEVSLITEANRTADVIAETDVTLFTIEKEAFLHFIRGTEFKQSLKKLAKTRDAESWNVLSTSHFFQMLTSTQKTMLESMMTTKEISEPGILIAEGEEIERVYIIRKGSVVVKKNGKTIGLLGKGDFIGEPGMIHRNELNHYTFINEEELSVYVIDRDDLLRFLEKNPGLIMKLTYDYDD